MLFEAARDLVRQAHPGPAVIVAQAAVEVGVETAIAFGLTARDVLEPLHDWIDTTVNSWSPTNERVQGLWRAVTGDKLSDVSSWVDYAAGVKARHAFAHQARTVTQEQAERFIAAAERVIAHVLNMIESLPEIETA